MIKNKTKVLIIATIIAIMPSSAFASVSNLNVLTNNKVLNKNNNGHIVTAVSNNNEASANDNYNKEDNYYESLINEYTFLSQDEKDILIKNNKEREKIYDKINKIYESEKDLTLESKTKITSYENELNNLEKNIKDINKKIRIHNNKELIDSYTFLTQNEKNLLLETYNSLDNIYEEKNEVFNGHTFDELNLKEKEKIKECDNKIIVLQRKIKDIKKKINVDLNEKMVKEYIFLTEQERSKLLNAYNEMNDVYVDIDELYLLNPQENNEKSNKLKELESQVNNIRNSIKDLNRKIRVYYDKESLKSYSNLTSDEKNTILKIYNDIYDIEDKIDTVYSLNKELTTEEKKEAENLTLEMNTLYEKIYAIEEKGKFK